MYIIYHNKYHILYIVMDETTKFTSHMCSEQWPFVSEKPHSLVMKALEWSTTFLK
jgi:hypothetical protein